MEITCKCGHIHDTKGYTVPESVLKRISENDCMPCQLQADAITEAAKPTKTISYAEYKNGNYRTVKNSYNAKTKTIEVYKNTSGLQDGNDGFYFNGEFVG